MNNKSIFLFCKIICFSLLLIHYSMSLLYIIWNYTSEVRIIKIILKHLQFQFLLIYLEDKFKELKNFSDFCK